jgi:argonaute-like protein implicated in RNA metabolism and viral defense
LLTVIDLIVATVGQGYMLALTETRVANVLGIDISIIAESAAHVAPQLFFLHTAVLHGSIVQPHWLVQLPY